MLLFRGKKQQEGLWVLVEMLLNFESKMAPVKRQLLTVWNFMIRNRNKRTAHTSYTRDRLQIFPLSLKLQSCFCSPTLSLSSSLRIEPANFYSLPESGGRRKLFESPPLCSLSLYHFIPPSSSSLSSVLHSSGIAAPHPRG